MGVAVFRRAALVVAPAVLVAVLSGCSSGEAEVNKADPSKPVRASASVAGIDEATPAAEAPDVVQSVKPGGSAVFKSGATAMTVSVGDFEYIPTPEGAMGSEGQTTFVRLHLTVKNTGKAPGEFSADTSKWSSSTSAPQSATVVTTDAKDRLAVTYQPGQEADGDVVVGTGGKGGTVTFYDAQDDEAPTFRVDLVK